MGDCRLGAISKLLEENDIFISPAMCFGLGEGYDFNYWVEKSMQLPMIVILGRCNDCEEKLLANLNIPYKKIGNLNNTIEENENELDALLDKYSKIFVTLDRYYLNYLYNRYEKVHCGFHSVLLSKSNNETEYRVYDVLDKYTSYVSKEEVSKARASDVQPFTPNFDGFYLEDMERKVEITEEMVRKAVEANMIRFLEDNDSGISSFNRFINQLKILSKMCSDTGQKAIFFKVQIKFLCKYIREFEETHTFYRGIYENFIMELKERYQINLENSSLELANLRRKWKDFGMQLIKISEEKITAQLEYIITELKELAECEKSFTECILSEIRT